MTCPDAWGHRVFTEAARRGRMGLRGKGDVISGHEDAKWVVVPRGGIKQRVIALNYAHSDRPVKL